MKRHLLVVVAALGALVAIAACHPAVEPATRGPVSTDRAEECRASCTAMNMKLQSVVLIMNNAGCVCVPLDAAPGGAAPSGGAAAAAGGAAIAVTVAEAQEHRQQASHH